MPIKASSKLNRTARCQQGMTVKASSRLKQVCGGMGKVFLLRLHPDRTDVKPYKFLWLSEKGEIVVNKQVLIAFSIGKYKDEVLCDVVSMEATHILLGRPCQFDRKNLHDGLTNKISLPSKGIRSY